MVVLYCLLFLSALFLNKRNMYAHHSALWSTSFDGRDMNPQKTFPLHFSPATKGPADIMSVILSLTQVCVDEDKVGDHSVMLIEFE
jgi:hypothetical protein